MWYPTPRVLPDSSRDISHPPFRHRALSRRRLLRSAAATSALALGARLWSPMIPALAASNDEAMPIPGGNDFLGDGHFVHVFVPAFGQETSTINHFNGFVAAAEIQGTGTGTDTTTGTTMRYYYDADMRFMDGNYIAADGRVRHGTFGFVWLDLFTGPVGQDGSDQIHDYEPGIMPNGLFWTVPITSDAIEMNFDAGTARFRMANMAIPDFHDFANSIGSAASPIPTTQASATFDVRWQATKRLIPLRDAGNGFAGDFMDSQATMAWSVEQPSRHFRFATDGAGTSTVGGVIGRERNGSYFHQAGPLLG